MVALCVASIIILHLHVASSNTTTCIITLPQYQNCSILLLIVSCVYTYVVRLYKMEHADSKTLTVIRSRFFAG